MTWGFHLRLGAAVGIIAACTALLSGPGLAFKSLFLYLPLWAVGEFLQGKKARGLTRCQTCHFDPMLYARDWRAARKLVEAKLGSLSTEITQRIQQRSATEVQNRPANLLAAAKAKAAKAPVPTPAGTPPLKP